MSNNICSRSESFSMRQGLLMKSSIPANLHWW